MGSALVVVLEQTAGLLGAQLVLSLIMVFITVSRDRTVQGQRIDIELSAGAESWLAPTPRRSLAERPAADGS